jgi:plasmid maintenance system antidote protein VapI
MADQLRKAMRTSGKTVNAIAVESGIPQPMLHRFLKGERDLTLRTAQKLADYFGVELRPKEQ